MDDFLPVRGGYARAYRRHDFNGPARRQRAFFHQYLVQRRAFDKFHHEKRHPFVDDAVIGDGDDVRVANRGGGQSFLAKARDQHRVVAH